MQLYFRDNMFNAGVTEILDEQQAVVGHLDLKSAFGSSIHVYGSRDELLCSGKFRFFSSKWVITDGNDDELGVLRSRFTFFSKKYTYEKDGRGSFDIESPAFSKEYEVMDESGALVARFEKVSRWFSSGAYLLDTHSDRLDAYELLAVIMGIHEIQKHTNTAAGGAT
ncbi:hypothetical protein [Paenibacillus whitsoniae]|uniref:LURP-one-related family protein n=1 Tax=Paenibacillus whitsoniae TaxID=2496558 RepID=A0A3S0CYE7_9BACL|nr:hypothetical protein [Paenibacillus whitsoniae]RTE11654.1 hypothetical protein EJQ19_01125 [Paenibacillus whitsoniae]